MRSAPSEDRLPSATVELVDGSYLYTFKPEVRYFPSEAITRIGQEILAALGNLGGLIVKIRVSDRASLLDLKIAPSATVEQVNRAFDILRAANIADLRISTEHYQQE